MYSSAHKYTVLVSQMTVGLVIGAVIACSPTRFSPSNESVPACESTATSTCVVSNSYQDHSETFKVGTGKVDILFVNDNSASMSTIQAKLKDRFSGFVQSLDSREVDYRIAVTTTDLAKVNQQKLIPIANGKSFISSTEDSNRVSLFNSAIIRDETLMCETFLVSMFNTYGLNFQYQDYYHSQYPLRCASSDTRGIYTARQVLSENSNSFVRSDATLNVILISNDEVRQGDPLKPFAEEDRAESFVAMMENKYPNKYWDFNSIIVNDPTCKDQQVLKNAQGIIVSNSQGPAISGGIGLEYRKLSNLVAKDLKGNPRPRGSILDICQNDYAQHFSKIATQISESSRLKTLKCKPEAAPVVQRVSNPNLSVPYTWDGNQTIVFAEGSEGIPATIKYRCYTGPR